MRTRYTLLLAVIVAIGCSYMPPAIPGATKQTPQNDTPAAAQQDASKAIPVPTGRAAEQMKLLVGKWKEQYATYTYVRYTPNMVYDVVHGAAQDSFKYTISYTDCDENRKTDPSDSATFLTHYDDAVGMVLCYKVIYLDKKRMELELTGANKGEYFHSSFTRVGD